jgi:hypothetical protein
MLAVAIRNWESPPSDAIVPIERERRQGVRRTETRFAARPRPPRTLAFA